MSRTRVPGRSFLRISSRVPRTDNYPSDLPWCVAKFFREHLRFQKPIPSASLFVVKAIWRLCLPSRRRKFCRKDAVGHYLFFFYVLFLDSTASSHSDEGLDAAGTSQNRNLETDSSSSSSLVLQMESLLMKLNFSRTCCRLGIGV